MIVCRNLVKRYGEHVAVDDLSFNVPAGQICAFLGQNGAGKSTTVKMITGLLAPTSGTAEVAGTTDPIERKRRIGVVPENLALYGALTPEEHLHLSGKVYGLSTAETSARTEDLLTALDLRAARRTPAEQCSHGTRKKTALALALLHNPRVLLLDEPFEGVDPVTAQTIAALLERRAERGGTIFFTSHILSMVERLAQRVLLIRTGRLIWDGDPHQLEQRYFEGHPPAPGPDLAWLG